MVGINLIGAGFVDRAQSLIVVVLLAVFAVFIVATLVDIDPHLLAFSGYPPVSDIIASVALTFLSPPARTMCAARGCSVGSPM
jgi:amino acid transporter